MKARLTLSFLVGAFANAHASNEPDLSVQMTAEKIEACLVAEDSDVEMSTCFDLIGESASCNSGDTLNLISCVGYGREVYMYLGDKYFQKAQDYSNSESQVKQLTRAQLAREVFVREQCDAFTAEFASASDRMANASCIKQFAREYAEFYLKWPCNGMSTDKCVKNWIELEE